eukprot:9405326-Alexandrium_andersonii.AAC.1
MPNPPTRRASGPARGASREGGRGSEAPPERLTMTVYDRQHAIAVGGALRASCGSPGKTYDY